MLTSILDTKQFRYVVVPETGCWEYQGYCCKKGYGRIIIYPQFAAGRTVVTTAHRFSWWKHRGPIPPRLYVCHHCDNKPCVNPDHLFLGNASDNGVDLARKGLCPSQKVTADLAQKVWVMIAERVRIEEIIERTGITRSGYDAIRHSETWAPFRLPKKPCKVINMKEYMRAYRESRKGCHG